MTPDGQVRQSGGNDLGSENAEKLRLGCWIDYMSILLTDTDYMSSVAQREPEPHVQILSE